MSEFLFPKNMKAANATLAAQVNKLVEEVGEVLDLVIADPMNDGRILEETYDVIHTAEGILRKYSSAQRKFARDFVEEKCKLRGDYEKE